MNRPSVSLALILLLSSFSAGTLADPQSQSWSNWSRQGDEISARFTIASREVTRLSPLTSHAALGEALIRHLTERLSIQSDDEHCTLSRNPELKTSKPGYLLVELRFSCPPAQQQYSLGIEAFFDLAPSHIHFARLQLGDGYASEQLFSNGSRAHALQAAGKESSQIDAPKMGSNVLRSYLWLGFEHILEGWDHIAFLLTLMLISVRLRDILLIVTGFTLGHSITLSLAVLGLAKPNLPLVESVIGLSIALVAIENVSSRGGNQRVLLLASSAPLFLLAFAGFLIAGFSGPPPLSVLGLAVFTAAYLGLSQDEAQARRFRPMVTALFGLVHGFGFANVLMEIGIPQDQVLPALFGFNLGVELGQLAIVALITVLAWLGLRLLPILRSSWTIDLASAALCALGCYWFVQRAYF